MFRCRVSFGDQHLLYRGNKLCARTIFVAGPTHGHAFRGIEVLVKTNPPFSSLPPPPLTRPFVKLERFLRLSRRARALETRTPANALTHYIHTWPSSRDIMCPFSPPPLKLTLRISMTMARLKRKGCGCRTIVCVYVYARGGGRADMYRRNRTLYERPRFSIENDPFSSFQVNRLRAYNPPLALTVRRKIDHLPDLSRRVTIKFRNQPFQRF